MKSLREIRRRLLPVGLRRRIKWLVSPQYRWESGKDARARDEQKRLVTMPRYTPSSTTLLGKTVKFVDACTYLLMYSEIFERQQYAFRSRTDRPFIIDGGANIGLSVLFFKQLYPLSRIIAFEPDPIIFDVLHDNCAVFGLNDVTLLERALWTSETDLSFIQEGSAAGRIGSSVAPNTVQVGASRLRDYLSESVDFLKIDIEGAESAVLEDCSDLLWQVGSLFVEHHTFEGKPQDLSLILTLLQDAGFRVYVEAATFSPQPFMSRRVTCGMDVQTNIFAFRP